MSLIKQIKPDVIVSFGAYVSVPVIIAAKIIGTKSIIHEQTLTNSLTTKICAPLVSKVALSFDHQPQIKELPASKIVITGNLLRREIFQNSSQQFSNPHKLPLIYVTGGNQGSSIINETIIKTLPDLEKFYVIHQTGPLDINKYLQFKKANYFPIEYIDSADIGWIYHHADIIISRSGANTCQEIAALQKKSILIPFPYAQQNEQLLNARWLQKQLPHETKIINQFELTSQKIIDDISYLIKLPSNKTTADDSPNQKLLDLIYELV